MLPFLSSINVEILYFLSTSTSNGVRNDISSGIGLTCRLSVCVSSLICTKLINCHFGINDIAIPRLNDLEHATVSTVTICQNGNYNV